MSYIVTLSGSPASRSRSTHLLAEAESRLRTCGEQVKRIDVRLLASGALIGADQNHLEVRAAIDTVRQARAVIVATPLYNAAYSGLLKVFLDLLPSTVFAGKPVLAFATGGTLAHLLALDYALKPVLTALGARHFLGNVFATESDVLSADGAYFLTELLANRLTEAVGALLTVLNDDADLCRMRAQAPAPALVLARRALPLESCLTD
jgi:FMN reductase